MATLAARPASCLSRAAGVARSELESRSKLASRPLWSPPVPGGPWAVLGPLGPTCGSRRFLRIATLGGSPFPTPGRHPRLFLRTLCTAGAPPPEPPVLKAFPQYVEKWELCRQDIHGRDVGMGLFDTEAAAEAAAEVYTARGHHQVYFVRRAVVRAGARVPATVIPPCPTLDD